MTFVAEFDERWVGLASGLAIEPDKSDPMLVGMFVDGTARRHGIGVALVECVTRWARAREAARLTLWVTASNEAAVALYARCGFLPTGARRPVAHTPTLVEIEMVRSLE